jgi:uncharacterized protein YwqG
VSIDRELVSLARKHHLEARLDSIRSLLRPAIAIQRKYETAAVPAASPFWGLLRRKPREVKRPLKIPPGGSRIGGLPELPTGFDWPRWKNRPLSLLAQINCAEITVHDSDKLWPASGQLYFFYDLKEQPWGGEPNDLGAWSVRYTESTDLSGNRVPNEVRDSVRVLPKYGLHFATILTLPGTLDSLDLDDVEFDSYYKLTWELRKFFTGAEPAHQSLGHADTIQGPVEDEWSELAMRLRRGKPQSMWKLLLQFDSDDELDVMWGDAGMLYFGIPESALRERRFDEVLMTMQCS